MRHMTRSILTTGALVLGLLGGAGIATAQVANHGIVSGSDRNLEQHPDTGGATTYPRGYDGSRVYNYDRLYNFDRADRDVPPADWQ